LKNLILYATISILFVPRSVPFKPVRIPPIPYEIERSNPIPIPKSKIKWKGWGSKKKNNNQNLNNIIEEEEEEENLFEMD
tara:strand:+ start:96 stop:335 length:240 start_codon:yes stop_codon:yes gene_type:complete